MVGDNKNISHILSTNAFLLSKFISMVFKHNKTCVKDSFNRIANRSTQTRSRTDLTTKLEILFSRVYIERIRALPVSSKDNITGKGLFGVYLSDVKNIAYKFKTPSYEKDNKHISKGCGGSHVGFSGSSNKRGFNTWSFINKGIGLRASNFLPKESCWFDGRLIFSSRLDYLKTNYGERDFLIKKCLSGYYGLSDKIKSTFYIPSYCFKVNNGCYKLSYLNLGNKHETRYFSSVDNDKRYVLFKNVKHILTKDPVNEATQRKIENFLVDNTKNDREGNLMF